MVKRRFKHRCEVRLTKFQSDSLQALAAAEGSISRSEIIRRLILEEMHRPKYYLYGHVQSCINQRFHVQTAFIGKYSTLQDALARKHVEQQVWSDKGMLFTIRLHAAAKPTTSYEELCEMVMK